MTLCVEVKGKIYYDIRIVFLAGLISTTLVIVAINFLQL